MKKSANAVEKCVNVRVFTLKYRKMSEWKKKLFSVILINENRIT